MQVGEIHPNLTIKMVGRVQTLMAQGRSTKIISLIKRTRTSRLSIIISLSRAGMRPGYGYGGPCYPRDNQALALYARQVPDARTPKPGGFLWRKGDERERERVRDRERERGREREGEREKE